jgi:hypothetical protein
VEKLRTASLLDEGRLEQPAAIAALEAAQELEVQAPCLEAGKSPG